MTGSLAPEHEAIFPDKAQIFLSELCVRYAARVDELLEKREQSVEAVGGVGGCGGGEVTGGMKFFVFVL